MRIDFTDYVPSPRYDGTSWTSVRIEESANEDGPWTIIDSQAITPDVDPAHPAAHSFTTVLATLAAGWYKVSFTDAANNVLPTEPVHNVPSLDAEYLPTLRQVGLVTLQRTSDDLGHILGTFTKVTQPTDDQVRELIQLAGEDVRTKIGGTIPDDLRAKAQRVIAIRTAMLIELSYFRREIASDSSPYPELKAMYDEEWPQLVTAVEVEEAGGDVEDAFSNSPAYAFEAPVGWMTKKM